MKLKLIKTKINFEIIQQFSFAYIFIWVRKLDFDSLTETKNWGGRNEATETSGNLHLLRLQNKQIHSPRTTDRLHTIQDRWHRSNWLAHIQRMPQNRIPLKSYLYSPQGKRTIGRPKKRWRAATVTLETERVKWPNPGCLWWWWWIIKIECLIKNIWKKVKCNTYKLTLYP